MKDFKQLKQDKRTNEELAKKLEEADIEARKSGDKSLFIKAAAELGYEITEQDLAPKDELVKLDEEELDDVAGGWGFIGTLLGREDENGHEICCFWAYFQGVESASCKKSNSGKHLFIADKPSRYVFSHSYSCQYCGMSAYTE